MGAGSEKGLAVALAGDGGGANTQRDHPELGDQAPQGEWWAVTERGRVRREEIPAPRNRALLVWVIK